MTIRSGWFTLACGALLLAPATAFSQTDNISGTREQRQQQTGSESDRTVQERPAAPTQEESQASQRWQSQQQSGRQYSGQNQYGQNQGQYGQNQSGSSFQIGGGSSQGYDRSSQGSRLADQRQYEGRQQSWNDDRSSSNDSRQGRGEGRQQSWNQSDNQQYGQQQYGNRQYANQSGQQYGQDWEQQRSSTYIVNPERWRVDREYRDAYFAGLRAGQRGATESNYFNFTGSSSDNESAENSSGERRLRLSGRVLRTSRENMPGSNSRDLQAQIRTDRGDRFWVDLGPENEARRLDLGEGDQITVKGIRLRLGDRTVVFATDANANDERLAVTFRDANERSGEQTGYESDRSDRNSSDRNSDRSWDRSSGRGSDRDQSGYQSRSSSRDESDDSQNRSSSQGRSQSDRDRSSSGSDYQSSRDRSGSSSDSQGGRD